jgi:hypothetical protein
VLLVCGEVWEVVGDAAAVEVGLGVPDGHVVAVEGGGEVVDVESAELDRAAGECNTNDDEGLVAQVSEEVGVCPQGEPVDLVVVEAGGDVGGIAGTSCTLVVLSCAGLPTVALPSPAWGLRTRSG